MKFRIVSPVIHAAFAGWLFISSASAQTSGADRASAEALFGEGVSLVAAGKYDSGCRKFEASQALDATLGTELRLADCYERAGKTASAWATFKHARGVAHVQAQTDREELARERVEALEPQLSYLTVTFDGPRPAGLSVTRNGEAVPLASLAVAIPVDPGTQTLTATAPDHESWQSAVDVKHGAGKTSVSIPSLIEHVAPQKPAASASPKPAPARSWRTAGIATGAVGIASILVGSGLGLYAKNQGDRSKRDEYCPNDDHDGCTAAGVELRDRARAFGTASTITFVTGAALLTTGIVLFSIAPSRSESHARARLQLLASGSSEAVATCVRGTW